MHKSQSCTLPFPASHCLASVCIPLSPVQEKHFLLQFHPLLSNTHTKPTTSYVCQSSGPTGTDYDSDSRESVDHQLFLHRSVRRCPRDFSVSGLGVAGGTWPILCLVGADSWPAVIPITISQHLCCLQPFVSSLWVLEPSELFLFYL